MKASRYLPVGASAVAAVLALSACGPQRPAASRVASAGAATAAPASAPLGTVLPTKCPGVFTVATDKPAYAPWFQGDDPANGKGYEAAVAYAVAKQLGFDAKEVRWVTASFNSVVTPGSKPFDVAINQFSISDGRRKAVDFSAGYYDVAQGVVAKRDSKIAHATTVAELAGAKLAAQVGTTSYTAIVAQIKPTLKPSVFDTTDLAVQALKNGQVDGIVVDLPTGFYMISAQLDGGTIVGQLPTFGAAEQFGLILEKGSPLTAAVSQAVETLRRDGTLARLQQEWLAGVGGVSELK
jgi:polar amino acid transport system substrate-binding protein